MGKKRIYELAKEINVSSKDIIEKAQADGLDVKNHMSTLDDASEKHLRNAFKKNTTTTKPEEKRTPKFRSSKTGKTVVKKSDHPAADGTKGIQRLKSSNNESTTRNNNNNKNGNQNRNNTNGRPNNNQNRPNNNRNQNNNRNGNRPNQPKRDEKQDRIRASVAEAARMAAQANREIANEKPQANRQRTNSAKPGEQRREGRNNQNRPNNNNRNGNNVNRTNNNNRPNNNNRNNENRPSRPNNTNQTTNNRPANNTTRPAAPAATTANNSGEKKQDRFSGRNNNSRGGNRFGNNQNRPFNKENRKNKKRNRKAKRDGRMKETTNKVVTVRKERPLPDVLEYSEGINVAEIAKKIHREPAEIIKKLFMMGVMVNQNQSLDNDTVELLAADYGIEAQQKVEVDISDIDKIFEDEEKNTTNLVSRPPVVTIMGHVDHGKTTLLDKLRHSHITEGEAGGITQGIGAYQLKHDDKLITFLDTPGHAAFTEMRARGADVTDITILVVAADDGVMPQTIEAINHAKAANVPIIVAVNKIDKQGANPNHVMEQLTEYGLIPESWGGDTIFVEISAKLGQNIDELLDMILLQAEVLELKANPDQNAAGSVIEAQLDPGKGSIATILVQQGTMHVGDPIVIGNTFGRIRTMVNEHGRRVKEATPSTPVEITGLNGVPEAGDRFVVFDDEKSARAAGEERAKRAQMEERKRSNHVTLDNLFDSLKEGEMKKVDIIIKADVQGSVEALADSLQKIEVEGVRVNIIHKAVGAINESDVTLAAASNAIIIGFNVRPTAQAKQMADSEDVDIRLHRVIYNAIDEVESAMKGMLEPVYEEEIIGQVDIRETYKVSRVGTIAGGFVTEGFITRDSGVRLIRDGVVIYEGKLGSLKRFKDDVKEVKRGFELGLTVENYNDIKIGDVIEAYRMKEVPVE
ncbi:MULTISPECIES: translation initiation factor IF-2 [Pediococcus]|uniref:Translation initiation factor IF-2 n=1 Tax=Pediococcus pentosaceus (strain ATCC 25745 / CCUG 21536 / LMG 10740 / 183-1w) TaxID=278197 RepID=IF2_PEDPA|nr:MULTISPECIES: translation initiation factor IF-2 [Pediococcus]Q03FS3.1 RecName: Full=Translation initiation factor IF-2 [Pediococcus pentosaceus ATCC 25745]ABJ67949.1 bacterial translation initiation factor 2 (bIF-2) [Pediococcus pentosaceus ATCC 25745]AVL01449.1 translation initiation factor IF-2 [Pediococcus pentosaceus]KAF5440959.1 translation initiation factor IF-2 [Pediococcus sp. EKM202D]KAF5441478.1 translation initiation factor IF-2 [Pediococcus sp. EKM201D]MBF7133839.1 translation